MSRDFNKDGNENKDKDDVSPGQPSADCSCSAWGESPAKLPCSSQAFELTPAKMVIYLLEGSGFVW